MRETSTIFAFILTLSMAFSLFAQPEAIIVVEAVSPQELHDWGWTSSPSNGLMNVGMGELVYLSGHEAADSDILSYDWSFVTLPNGSSLSGLDSTSTAWTTFRPDTTGQYVIQLSITTTEGMADTTVTITSAKYLGVGTIGGASPSFFQCGSCHSTMVDEWVTTRHSSKFQRDIDGAVSFYDDRCLACHTVGFDTLASNDGFDDIARKLGWSIPDSLQPGNFDNMVVNYPELAQKTNIQCENCHGAGSEHMGDKLKIGVTIDEGLCGKCHEAEPYHRKNIQWKNSKHSEGVASASTRDLCNKCHSGWAFIDRIDGVAPEQWRMGSEQISCAVCHDPHNAANEHQLRSLDPVTLPNGVVVEGGHGTICMNCHQSRNIIDGEFVSAEVYVENYLSNIRPGNPRSFDPHHGPQTDMLAATNIIDFGEDLPTSPHLQRAPDACVTCHMTEDVIEGGKDHAGEHTWSMHVEDLGKDNVAACEQCHGYIGEKFEDKFYYDAFGNADHDGDGIEEGLQLEVMGLLDTLKFVLMTDTIKFIIDRGGELRMADSSVSYTEAAAAYNHNFIMEDQSLGIHNPKFTVALLQLSINKVRDEATSFSDKLALVPDQYSLSQNFPNPFNPQTKINFTIVKNGLVSLRVFDLLGRQVKTLINKEMPAGHHEVVFDGSDLASGIYFYNLMAGDFSQNRKMILMK